MRDTMVIMSQEEYVEQLAECRRVNEKVANNPDGMLAHAILHAKWENTIFSLNEHGEIELDGEKIAIEVTSKTKSNE